MFADIMDGSADKKPSGPPRKLTKAEEKQRAENARMQQVRAEAEQARRARLNQQDAERAAARAAEYRRKAIEEANRPWWSKLFG
jgi:hypothetical protein